MKHDYLVFYNVDYIRAAIGIVLAEYRKEKNISQQRLADFAQISLSHLKDIEGGKSSLTFDKIFLLLFTLNIKPSEFFEKVVAIYGRKPRIIQRGRGFKRLFLYEKEKNG